MGKQKPENFIPNDFGYETYLDAVMVKISMGNKISFFLEHITA